MSRAFALPTVLRMVSNELLRELFNDLGICADEISWDKLKHHEVDPLVKLVTLLPGRERDFVERQLHDLFDLACDSGRDAMLEAARLCGSQGLAETFRDGNPYDHAAKAFLHYREAFDKALMIYRTDHLSWWRKRDDLPRGLTIDLSEAAARLQQSLSEYMVNTQGRGQHCTVERMERNGGEYFFAHLDDFVQSVQAHNEHGKLESRSFRGTFVVAYAFVPTEGTLELFTKLPSKQKNDLEELFCEAVLGRSLGRFTPPAAYRLNHLLHPEADLAVDVEDGFRPRIRKMRLALRDSGRRITVEADPERGPADIYDALDECLDERGVPLDDGDLNFATFQFEFPSVDGKRAGSLTFDVGVPNSCSLRNQRQDRVDLARKYMKRWGIDVSGTMEAVAASASLGTAESDLG